MTRYFPFPARHIQYNAVPNPTRVVGVARVIRTVLARTLYTHTYIYILYMMHNIICTSSYYTLVLLLEELTS